MLAKNFGRRCFCGRIQPFTSCNAVDIFRLQDEATACAPYGPRPKDSSIGDHDNKGSSDSDETDRDDEEETEAVDKVKDELVSDELQ